MFDPNKIVKWRENKKDVWGTNVERMEAGKAPIGHDGWPVELHHLKQTHEGPIAETSKEFHNQYTSVIHNNPNTMGSGIDRDILIDGDRNIGKNVLKIMQRKI